MKYLFSFLLILCLITNINAQSKSRVKNIYEDDEISEYYADGTSIGVSLLGEGIVGLQFRTRVARENQIGLNASLSGVTAEIGPDEYEFYQGLALGAEYNILLGSRMKERPKRNYVKRKFKKHYLSVKAVALFARYQSVNGVITWRMETFYPADFNYSRGFDLGLSYQNFFDSFEAPLNSVINLFIKVDWNWYRNNRKF